MSSRPEILLTDKAIEHGGLGLRPVSEKDEEMLFKWRNLDEIIHLSVSRKAVRRSEHRAWFQSALTGEKMVLFIITSGEEPVGQLRFDRKDSTSAVITIYLLAGARGQGHGPRLIGEGCELIKQSWPEIERIFAIIRETNQPSLKAFGRAGFIAADVNLQLDAGLTALYLDL